MSQFRYFFLSVLLILALNLSGCSLFRRSSTSVNEPVELSTQVESPESAVPVTPLEAAKPNREKKKITLVLGGAGIASFATVGLLKRLNEEGIEIETLITTGWPSLFALASGFLRSVHDVEWFAMRLQEKDFYKASKFDPNKGDPASEKLSPLIETHFKQKEIEESKFSLIISSANTEGETGDKYDRGDWRTPLLKTMSIPGLFKPYPKNTDLDWIQSLQGIDVEEAKKRGGTLIVAVEMYGDYYDFLKAGNKDSSDGVFRQLYLTSLKKNVARELKEAQIVSHIQLQSSPTNFSQKRLAIFSGYKEGARLAKAIRSLPKN